MENETQQNANPFGTAPAAPAAPAPTAAPVNQGAPATSAARSEDFSDDYVPQANWFKFEHVGDAVKGTLVSRFFKEGSGDFPDQEVLELTNVEVNGVKQEDNWFVPVKSTNTYVLSRIKNCKIGQRLGFKFTAEIPAKVKGHHNAKSITPYVWEMDPTYKMAEDMGGSVVDNVQF